MQNIVEIFERVPFWILPFISTDQHIVDHSRSIAGCCVGRNQAISLHVDMCFFLVVKVLILIVLGCRDETHLGLTFPKNGYSGHARTGGAGKSEFKYLFFQWPLLCEIGRARRGFLDEPDGKAALWQ